MRLLPALIIIAIVLTILAFKSNGAVDHPLLVDAAAEPPEQPQPHMLFVPCPLSPRNIPVEEEREA